MHLKLGLFAIFAFVQLASSQPLPAVPVVQLSPVLQFRQAQGQVLPPRQPSITRATKSQQAALRANVQPVTSAIITKRTQEVLDVPVEDADAVLPQIVIVEPSLQPVTIEFRSRSSPVKINTVHVPGEKGQVQETRSEEEPDRIIHEVVKPVIQEIREIIQPFRKITQQILPVQEEVHSIVSKGEKRSEVEQVTDEAALASATPDSSEQQQEVDAALQARQREVPALPVLAPPPAPVAPAQITAVPVQLQAVPAPFQIVQPAFISAPLPPPPPPPQQTNTVVQAGLVGGTRILPASEAIYEQQREIVSAIAAPGGLKKKKRSANIFRFDIP